MTQVPVDTAELSALATHFRVDRLTVLNQGGWGNGDVFLGERGDQKVVIKTYRRKPRLMRWIGRYLLSREGRAYRVLAGIEGVPELLSCPDRSSLALQYVPGEKINNKALAEHGHQILSSLRALVETMHSRGVYHMDLRNQGNILVDRSHRATILDFASAVIIRRRGRLSRAIARLCRRFDLYGLSKWEARCRVSA
ncbi:MAG: hypothetical protein R3200_01395 [Xanthomonadales bacterium]|nr:hypothetical protein [Xanthomonadales bacterium]